MRVWIKSDIFTQLARLARGVSEGAAATDKAVNALPRSVAASLYNTKQYRSSSMDPQAKIDFAPKKILILSKVTRYEFEKRVHRNMRDKELETMLKRRGTDVSRLVNKHELHHAYVKMMQDELKSAGIEWKVVQRWDYTDESVEWADAVMSAGGDGTFLMAASKIRDRRKPVIGINTDPNGSEGYMCLLRKLPMGHFKEALRRLLSGQFQWLFRQRIRITVTGDNGVADAIELHDQELNRNPVTTRWSDNPRGEGDDHRYVLPEIRKRSRSAIDNRMTIELPVLALNEVFVGESLSSRVSYYEIKLDKGQMLKQKSSGITICTGTGSTSWYFNINKLTDQCVQDMMKIVAQRCNVALPFDDPEVLSDVCTQFNQQLIYDPDLPKMAFSVRDPVFNATFPPAAPRGFAEKICVKSRGYDAHLIQVVDGGVSYRFNDGSEAMLEVCEEDALRTVVFR